MYSIYGDGAHRWWDEMSMKTENAEVRCASTGTCDLKMRVCGINHRIIALHCKECDEIALSLTSQSNLITIQCN